MIEYHKLYSLIYCSKLLYIFLIKKIMIVRIQRVQSLKNEQVFEEGNPTKGHFLLKERKKIGEEGEREGRDHLVP